MTVVRKGTDTTIDGNTVAITNSGSQIYLKNGDECSTQIFGRQHQARERYDAIVAAITQAAEGGAA